jgi:hypothetical protein
MQKVSLGLIASAAIFAAASAHAQSATPIEGNPSTVRPALVAPSTTGAGPATRTAPTSPESSHMPGGNPDKAPASTQSHEPPAK